MKIKNHAPAVPEVDMTPMIDIVFQLIAFFMLVTNFDNAKADERVKLPRDQLAKPAEQKREEELMLNVGYIRSKVGDIQSDPLLFYGTGEDVPVLQAAPLLNREARLYTDLGKEPKSVTVVIRSDADVPTGLVQELIKFSQEAGFEKFALKATQATDP